MGILGGNLGYSLLRKINDGSHSPMDGDAYEGKSKLDELLGPRFWADVEGKTVVDFGCGEGHEAVELAQRGRCRVIGVDVRPEILDRARQHADHAGVSDRCTFSTAADREADVIVSLDSFEHFADPANILQIMETLLKPGGSIWVSFGPTWYHPRGGHLFSVFPWAHLMFTESALIRWRSDFKTDGATRFGEVAGGLNQMTIRRFEHLVAASPFRFEFFEPVPIRVARPLHCRLTREWFTSVIRCKLVRR